MVIGWLIAVAGAQECAIPYPIDALLDDIGAVESSLLRGDRMAAGLGGKRLRDGLPCLESVLPSVVAGRALRAVGAGLRVRDSPEAVGWLEAAAALDPRHRYTLEDLPDGDPLFDTWRDALAAAADTPPEVTDRTFVAGEHWLDGRSIEEATAHPGVPHLYQHRGARSRQLQSFVIVGPVFPGAVLESMELDVQFPRAGAGVVAPATPDPSEAEVPAISIPGLVPIQIEPATWPPERIALVSGGTAALVGSGVLYALSTQTEARFRAASQRDEIDRHRTATNRLAVGSGAAGTVGVFALSFGLLFYIVDGPGGPVGPDSVLRVRF